MGDVDMGDGNSVASRASVAGVYRRVDAIEHKVDKLSTDFDIYKMSNQRVESKIDDLLRIIGHEQEDGKGGYTGVGMMGRLRRAEDGQEALQQKYRAWIAWGSGFCTALFAAVAVVWWLVADKVEVVLKGASQ